MKFFVVMKEDGVIRPNSKQTLLSMEKTVCTISDASMGAVAKPDLLVTRSKIEGLKKELNNLNNQITELTGLLGPSPYDEPPSTIFLYGDSGTGKTLLLENCLSIEDYAVATVNCLEFYSFRDVYESIISQLTKHSMNAENSFQPYCKCNNMLEFILELRNVSEKFKIGKPEGRSIIIVLDKCEKLRTLNKNVIPAFLKLKELTELKVCVLLVSTLPWTMFFTTDHVTQPITIFLDQYDQKQLHQILANQRPENVSKPFYDNFVSMFLSVFFNACHDVRELQYQIKLSFSHYYEPVCKGELSENDSGQLWKRCQPFFKKALRSLYLKVDCKTELAEAENITSVTSQALTIELPFYSKYIIIGSYIASYNPASEDKRLFVKKSEKKKKSKKIKSERVKYHLVGPKPFSLQRLFAIVAAILGDEKFALNADIFVEVGNLVQMKLLVQISDDILDAPTLKCNVGLQFVDVIARNVHFPLRKYLIDFMDC